MRVVGGQRRELRREQRGEGMQILGPVHAQHRFDTGQRGGLGRDGGGVGAQQDDADVGVRDPLGAGHAFRGGGIQGFSVVFTDDEYLVH